jgi:hypothetical protein
MTKLISKDEELSIVGLLALASEAKQRLDDIIYSLEVITQEGIDSMGHCADAVYCDYSAKELLSKLDIKVEKKKK